MEAAQQLTEGIEVSTVLQNGSLPDQSPARGVSGANPKLVNGEAVASDEERQVLSTQSVLKKVMTVSEAELLQSNAVDEAAASSMSSEGGGASACVSGSTAAQLKEREMSDCDGKPSEVSLTQSTSASAVPTSLPCEGTTSLSLHLQLSSSAGGVSSPSGQLVKPTMANTSKQTVMSPAAKVGGARSSGYGSRPHRSVGGAGGMVMSTAPAAANSVYYHYVPVPNAPLYYSTQPQQYPTAPVVHSSLSQPPGIQQEKLSSTNLYIRGLSRVCSDDDLISLCKQYGKIVSTKAILDKHTNLCKGYGFVDFENPSDAAKAVHYLQGMGIMVQFAKLPLMEQDPTNLYFSNLPKDFEERDLETLISPYGVVVSTRILRDQAGVSRGVGFARMETQESCERIIEVLKGGRLPGHAEPLQVKFADSGSKKKQSRWRDMQDYIYDGPVMPQNGSIVNSHGLVRQGVLAPQYVPTAAAAIPGAYQVPVSGVSSHSWAHAYYMQPANPIATSSAVDSVHALGAQMSGLQISSAGGGAYPTLPHGGSGPQPGTQYQVTAQYTHQTPAGWNVQHLSAPILHQDPSADHLGAATGVAGSLGDAHPTAPPTTHPPHPVQVINPPDHHTYRHHGNTPKQHNEGTSHSIHVYRPNSDSATWSGK